MAPQCYPTHSESYIPNLEGILIAWESFELQDTTLAIRGDIYSVVEVPISATLLIWAPKPGSILRGKVVKMGTDYVALTIFNLWSASITKKYVPFDFNFSPEVFKQGEYVQFKVRRYVSRSAVPLSPRLVVNHGLVSLKGSLEGENCGIVNAQNEIEQPKVSPSGLARKHHVPESPRLSSIADPTDDDEPPTV